MTLRAWPLLVGALAAGAAQQPSFKSSVEAVRVDVLVTRAGQLVTGLTARDFQIRDNGVLQNVDHVSFEDLPLNVVFALDGSDSVKGDRERRLRAASVGVLDRLEAQDQAALVRFGDAVVIQSPLTPRLDQVRAAFNAPLPLGNTSLVDAAYASLLLGDAPPGRTLVIAFTDGLEVSSYLDAASVLEAAKRSDAVVYGVEPARGGTSLLRNLTEATGGELFDIPKDGNLDATFAQVLDQFRRRYLVSYTPRGVAAAGWHRLQVRVGQPGVTVRARPGYTRN